MLKRTLIKRAAYIILPLLVFLISTGNSYAQNSDINDAVGTRVYTDASYKARTVADILLKRASLTGEQYTQVYNTTYNLVQSNDKMNWGTFKNSMKNILNKSQRKQLQSAKSDIQAVLGKSSSGSSDDAWRDTDSKKDKKDKKDKKVKKDKKEKKVHKNK